MKFHRLVAIGFAGFIITLFPPQAGAQTSAASPLADPVTVDNLDPAAFVQWVDGAEQPVLDLRKGTPRLAETALWTSTPHFMWPLVVYGDSKNPGVRYLRFGFKKPVLIGTVIAEGGGQLSVLKPDAPYPGNLNDDSQWIPAERLKNGQVITDEAGNDELALWVLPSVTPTRALRFKHVAQPSDRIYGGTFAGARVLSERLANLSPQAIATAQSMPQYAGRFNDEKDNSWGTWGNIPYPNGERAKTVAEDPEWVILTWPAPVTLSGLAMNNPGFSAADIQVYTGPADSHPGMATGDAWKTIKTLSGIKCLYPDLLPVEMVDFESPVTTRAIRLRLTTAFDRQGLNNNIVEKPMNGKRVWLDELMALKTLDTAGLKTALLPVATDKSHAPIPIQFTLPEAGFVTLVIEDSTGKRIRNLVSETPFPAGKNTVYWDGTDDIGRDADASNHGLYSIPAQMVAPGDYTVRGLWHRKIDLRYQMSVYSPGNPSWPTQDTSGGWMTNHTPASCAVFIPGSKAPGGQPLVGIGSYVSEGGSAFSWVDLNGRKVGGRGWIGGVWTGAQYLAGDYGSGSEPDVTAYVGSVFVGGKKYGVDGKIEIRLTKLTNLIPAGDKPVLKDTILLDPLPPDPNAGKIGGTNFDKPVEYLGGLAVHNGLLAFSETAYNKLVFIDAKAGTILGEAPLTKPGALAFDAQGRLLALSGTSLLRFTLAASPLPLPAPETLVSGFADPQGITLDATGNIYIADQGDSNQVKAFGPDGKPLRIYGHPGVPKTGPYDPLHMNHPKGIAVDSNGRLWVTEEWFQPKRVSVWNTDGTLWKDYLGPAQYGGGGALDPKDGNRFSYNGMDFQLDWDQGTWALKRVYYLNDSGLKLAFREAPPDAALYFNNRRYMTNAFTSNPTQGSSTTFLFLDQGDSVVPVAAAGCANDWDILKTDAFKSIWPPGIDPNGDRGKNQAVFLWSDLNGDGQVQPNEVKIWAGHGGGVTVAGDGSFVFANMGAPGTRIGHAIRFAPASFTPQGIPVYDADKGETLADSQNQSSSGGDEVLLGTDGWTIMTTAPLPYSSLGLGGVKNGVPLWSYPSLWPGLHASHNSPAPERPGELIGTTRLLGETVTPKDSDAGPLFFINGNQGDMFVLTQDGLFVSQLFQDTRQGQPWEMPQAPRGMLVNDLTIFDESFFPTVSQVPDGSIYVTTGKVPALVKVDGLESIQRIAPFTVSVSEHELALAQEFVMRREQVRQAALGTGILKVPMSAHAPAMNANLDVWGDAAWALIDQRGVGGYFSSSTKPYDVKAAVAVADGKLFAIWKTVDPRLLENSGAIANAPFKTGGALDLMIGTDPAANPHRTQPVAGDLRLLVTQVNGKTKAELYRQVVPGTPDKLKVPFNAPWHGITFDSVTDVSDQVQLVASHDGNYEVAVPLALLGLNPKDGMKINADVGILRGDKIQTMQRVYWNNKATAVVSDVPSEAMLTPGLWGIWEFHSQ